MSEVGATQVRIRIPEDLRTKIEAAAGHNRRSVNAEFAHRLEQSFVLPEQVGKLRNRLAEREREAERLEQMLEEGPGRATSDDGLQRALQALQTSTERTERTLISVIQTVTNASEVRRQIERLESILALDAIAMGIQLAGEKLDPDLNSPPYYEAGTLADGTVIHLLDQIDNRTAETVRLALAYVGGVDDAKAREVLDKIAKDHALRVNNRFAAEE